MTSEQRTLTCAGLSVVLRWAESCANPQPHSALGLIRTQTMHPPAPALKGEIYEQHFAVGSFRRYAPTYWSKDRRIIES